MKSDWNTEISALLIKLGVIDSTFNGTVTLEFSGGLAYDMEMKKRWSKQNGIIRTGLAITEEVINEQKKPKPKTYTANA